MEQRVPGDPAAEGDDLTGDVRLERIHAHPGFALGATVVLGGPEAHDHAVGDDAW
ncbi:MAG TPA: hypothetical protein VNO31_27235 [Umezawaea sp.]|nr:hypothetical protein [Umezawaea sp.]